MGAAGWAASLADRLAGVDPLRVVLVDDETLDTFLQEPSNVAQLPVPPTEYRREFQRMIVSAYLHDVAA